jgi:putative mRNA 3-end processing factor
MEGRCESSTRSARTVWPITPRRRIGIAATGAERVWATHGSVGAVVRWLEERGSEARAVHTRWEGERDEEGATDGAEAAKDE